MPAGFFVFLVRFLVPKLPLGNALFEASASHPRVRRIRMQPARVLHIRLQRHEKPLLRLATRHFSKFGGEIDIRLIKSEEETFGRVQCGVRRPAHNGRDAGYTLFKIENLQNVVVFYC